MTLASRELVLKGRFGFRWVSITWCKIFLNILNYLTIAVWHLISTYAHISPSDIWEIILNKKGLKKNSDAVLKIYILPWLSYFPDVLKEESFQYFFSVLLAGFPNLPHISTDVTNIYWGLTSSKDEWPPSLLSLHPSQGELYCYWANKANRDARCSSNRICLTRWWSLCQSVSLNDYWATGPFSDIASGVVFIKASFSCAWD